MYRGCDGDDGGGEGAGNGGGEVGAGNGGCGGWGMAEPPHLAISDGVKYVSWVTRVERAVHQNNLT